MGGNKRVRGGREEAEDWDNDEEGEEQKRRSRRKVMGGIQAGGYGGER